MITLKEIHERDKRPPSVTVSMTCYNHAKYIDEAIRGVLMQKTNFPVNIVIHDDASPDESQEIIRRYVAENPNITAILEETNYYQNGRSFFLKVLPHLTGKYIAYCECDDFWIDEHKLQIQVDYLEANPDCVAVYSNTLPVNKHSQYDESVRVSCFPKTGEGDYPKFWRGLMHQTASLVIRNFFRLMTKEDMDFYLSVKCHGDVKTLPVLLGLGRVHFFSQEFAAHRCVTDEGTSWSARAAKMSGYELYKIDVRFASEVHRMLEHYFGRTFRSRYRAYFDIRQWDLRGRKKYNRSPVDDIPLPEYQSRNIPILVRLLLATHFSFLATKHALLMAAILTAKFILPSKIWSVLREMKKRMRMKSPFML